MAVAGRLSQELQVQRLHHCAQQGHQGRVRDVHHSDVRGRPHQENTAVEGTHRLLPVALHAEYSRHQQ